MTSDPGRLRARDSAIRSGGPGRVTQPVRPELETHAAGGGTRKMVIVRSIDVATESSTYGSMQVQDVVPDSNPPTPGGWKATGSLFTAYPLLGQPIESYNTGTEATDPVPATEGDPRWFYPRLAFLQGAHWYLENPLAMPADVQALDESENTGNALGV